jgi:hypothetical protein
MWDRLALVRLLIIGLCALLCGLSVPARAADDDPASRVKAVFVYNFAQFVRWPKSMPSDVFKVGALGKSAIVKPLKEIAKVKKAAGMPLDVTVFGDKDKIEPCRILIVPKNRASEIDSLRDSLEMQHVLLVGDGLKQAGEGSAINFVVVDGKLRFEVSQNALRRAGLTASAHLLRLALLVDTDDD